jgi:hypothetical protein
MTYGHRQNEDAEINYPGSHREKARERDLMFCSHYQDSSQQEGEDDDGDVEQFQKADGQPMPFIHGFSSKYSRSKVTLSTDQRL